MNGLVGRQNSMPLDEQESIAIIHRSLGSRIDEETRPRSPGILEHATEGVFRTTPQGRYLSANRALSRMFGYRTPEELLANVADIGRQTYVTPENREELRWLLETQGFVKGYEIERLRRDGTKFWMSINGHVVRDSRGAVLYYEGTNQDITVR